MTKRLEIYCYDTRCDLTRRVTDKCKDHGVTYALFPLVDNQQTQRFLYNLGHEVPELPVVYLADREGERRLIGSVTHILDYIRIEEVIEELGKEVVT